MGMEQKVVFGGRRPSWTGVDAVLKQHGYPVEMRMIDGQLAFPGESPPESWGELRLGTPGGMITVRSEGDTVLLVTWGNADDAMRQAWNALTWAFAEAGNGQVVQTDRSLAPAEFRKQVALPAQF